MPSPCFVTDLARLEDNLRLLNAVTEASGAHILTALKAFSLWSTAPLVSRYLAGACASGLYEARLARAHYSGLLSCFAPAYKTDEMDELAGLCDHIIFNTPQQISRFAGQATAQGAELGLGESLSAAGEVEKYDPAAPRSRLGTPVSQLADYHFDQISGLHIHSLCEQGFSELANVISVSQTASGQGWRPAVLAQFGGAYDHSPDYDREALINCLCDLKQRYDLDIYLEPGTAIAFDAGILVGEVMDIMENDGPIAILDISATCHMPDVLEARPASPAGRSRYRNRRACAVGRAKLSGW